MTLLPALAALALTAASPAQHTAAPLSTSVVAEAPSSRLKLLGLQVDGGVPDGGVVSLVVRPIKWVRADAGFAYNYFAMGARGGVTLVPFHWAIVPTLRLEGGRFFKTDITSKAERFASDIPTYMKPALEGFGYDYASAQVGLEFGSQRSFVFFVRGGLAWLKADFGDATGIQDGETEVDVTGLSAHASGPTASLGFLFYVW
jgi:hypothetical protein